jgi:hypothetical protein
LAGQGSPAIDEFCIPEVATRLGMTCDSVGSYLTDVVELRYRLPQLWAGILIGDVSPWRALGCTCGPAPSETNSSATTPAPDHSTQDHHPVQHPSHRAQQDGGRTRPTTDYTAPHPADPVRGRRRVRRHGSS